MSSLSIVATRDELIVGPFLPTNKSLEEIDDLEVFQMH